MLGTIIRTAPEILDRTFRDGSKFRVSDTFMRSWLHSTMNWSRRKGTRAAQKLPQNWEDQCEKSAQRKAYLIKEYDIPAELYVNSDQTQRLYAPGDKLTYAETGARQVSVIGGDEKRAFTVLVTVTSAGLLLLFQTIYQGQTDRSCPRPAKSRMYAEAVAAGFRFEYSKSKTYWSNQRTMRLFVDHMLAPYFERTKIQLGRPANQRSLWQIDVWSVHRSDEFLSWMHDQHPTILIDFVPGGCTRVAQPCDVGIQRIFKHITNQAFLEDIVDSTITQLDANVETTHYDDHLPTLHDASVRWIWKAYMGLNKKDIVQKVSYQGNIERRSNLSCFCQAFKLCVVRKWDLSYATLRSFDMQESLRMLREQDAPFWNELTTVNPRNAHAKPKTDEVVAEDVMPEPEDDEEHLDDTDISLQDVVTATHQDDRPKKHVAIHPKGGLTRIADAEKLDELPMIDEGVKAVEGRGKRQRTANRQYADFSRHWDNEESDVD